MRIQELPDPKVTKDHATYVDFILDYIFALGSTAHKNQPNQPGHNYAELFDGDKWFQVDSYPYEEIIWRQAMLYYDTKFYVFGGLSDSNWTNSKLIVHLNKNLKWHKDGVLIIPRRSHTVIVSQSEFLVIGGHGADDEPVLTEKCSISEESHKSNTRVTCTTQEPLLYQYQLYPEVFAVPDDYCKSL